MTVLASRHGTTTLAFVAALVLGSCVNDESQENSRIDKLALVNLAKEREFATLESALDDYQRAYEEGRRSEGNVVFAFDAFAFSDPTLEPILLDWVEYRPRSASAALAIGTFYAHLGHLSRGNRSASETSAAAIAEMNRFFDLARPHLHMAINRGPRLVPAVRTLILLEKSAGNSAAAKGVFEAATEALPDSSTILKAYVSTQLRQPGGSRGEALGLLSEARERYGDDADHAWIRAYMLHLTASELQYEDPTRAAALYDLAVSISDDASVRYQRANFLFNHQRRDEAVGAFQELLDEGYEWVSIHRQIGIALQGMGYRRRALEHYNRALELDPYNPVSLRLRGGIYSDIGQPQLTEMDYEKARTFAEYQPYMHEMRGYLYTLMMPNVELSIDAWRRASELAPNNTQYLLRLAAQLHSVRDCEVFVVHQRFLDLCEAGQSCSQQDEFLFPSLLKYMDCPTPSVPH